VRKHIVQFRRRFFETEVILFVTFVAMDLVEVLPGRLRRAQRWLIAACGEPQQNRSSDERKNNRKPRTLSSTLLAHRVVFPGALLEEMPWPYLFQL
jgi:hypothetical protein